MSSVADIPGSRRVEHIMGLPIVLDIRDEEFDESAVDDMFSWLEWVDRTFSTYKDASEISRLSRGELALEDAHEDVRAVLARCEELRTETAGFFDMSFGDGLDPSGLVKGWSIDRAADLLQDAGIRNFAVNAGGDMRLSGRAVPEPLLACRHPTPARTRARRGDLRADRQRRRDVGDIRPRRACPEPSHRPFACRSPLGDDHRSRSRYRGRLCNRGLRDGPGGPSLDGEVARL